MNIKLTEEITKVLVLPDLHLKTIPMGKGKWGADVSPALWTALNFGKYFKPHITLLLGDFINLNAISFWAEKHLLEREGQRLKYDFELGQQVLDIIDKFTSGQKIYLLGNHERRLSVWISQNPQADGLISLDHNLGLDKRGWKIVEEGKRVKIGHANFIHGWYWNKYHSAKTVSEMGDNIFYGHVHDVQCFSKPNPDQKPIIGKTLGCLCDLNPEWRKNKPNTWVNGFGVFYFWKNGNFTHYNPIIIDGQFIWDGKIFKAK